MSEVQGWYRNKVNSLLRQSKHSVETTIYRLTKMFAPVAHQPLALLTSERAKDLLANLTDWSVDTRRNTLAEAKTFCKEPRRTAGPSSSR